MKWIKLIVATAFLAAGSFQVQATIVTLNYSGLADLTSFGASATSTVSGSLSWDSSSSPNSPPIPFNGTLYDPLSVTFLINGIDYSSLIDGSLIGFYDDAPDDHVDLFLTFLPMLDLDSNANTPDVGGFELGVGSNSRALWTGYSLPDNTEFLTDPLITYRQAVIFDQVIDPATANFSILSDFSIVDASIPTPSTLALFGLCLAGLGISGVRKCN